MKTMIVCNLDFEGLHHWPDACAESRYLKDMHRHLFKVCCKKEVTDDNRQIEFIDFKHKILNWMDVTFPKMFGCVNIGTDSCEMFAKRLMNIFELDYCSVLEDGENGAEVFKIIKHKHSDY